nr:MAG TPA: hypothetical protein [Bacteriophage sp.]
MLLNFRSFYTLSSFVPLKINNDIACTIPVNSFNS